MKPPTVIRSLGPRYIALWLGQSAAAFGTGVAILAIPQLIRHIQDAAGYQATFEYSLTYALETAPVFLIGIVGGVLLDRWALRGVLVGTALIRAVAFFLLSANVGSFGIGTVFAAAFLLGSMSTMFDGALYSMVPSIVRKDRLADANSLISVSIQINDSIGPFVAGALLATFGTPAMGLFLTGVMYVVGAIAIHWVGPVPRHLDPSEERQKFLTDAANGIRYLWSEDRLRTTTIAAGVANFVMGFIESTILVLIYQMIGAPNETAEGILVGVMGIGGVLGAVFAPALTRRVGLGRTMILGLLVMGAGLLAVMFSSYGVLVVALQIGWPIGISVVNVPLATIRQHYSSEAMLGRVITASRAISWATLPLGALLGGWLGNSPETYPWVARSFPILLLLAAVWLMTTVVWSDTFGEGFSGQSRTAQ